MTVLLALTLIASFLQAPSASPATIEGQVVKAGAGEPLEGVTVELVRVQAAVPTAVAPGPRPVPSPPLAFKTGRDGRFVIQNVPSGEYRLYGTHSNSYGPAEYGQRSPTGLGMPLILTAGQNKTGIRLTMSQTASISGRVTDGNREPAAFTSMLAFRIVYREGVRTVEVVQSVLTDDRGEYRLFWLVPGRYYLSALPIQARPYGLPLSFPSRVGGAVYVGTPVIALRAAESGEIFDETYLPMYYPGSMDIRGAKPIILSPGENLRADFNVGPTATRTLQVSGVVVDGVGQPAANARISLAPRRSEGHSVVVPAANSDTRGAFSLRGIVPGSYLLYVTSQGLPFPEPGTPPPPPGTIITPLTATVPIEVGTSNINNLKVQAVPGAEIPWTLAFEPRAGADPTPPSFDVSLVRNPDLAGAPPSLLLTRVPGPRGPGPTPPPDPVLRGVGSGDYRVTVGPLPRTGYVKSIRLGNIDVLKDGLSISGPVREQLQIVVSANAGTLDGTVLDLLNRQPFSNATVALLPEISQRPNRPELIKNTTSSEDGKFHFEGVAPGEYRIFAWEDVPPGEWYDIDFMLKNEVLGTTVQIDEAKTKTIDVRVIPAERSGQ